MSTNTAVAEREPAPEQPRTGTAVARKSEAETVRQALEKMKGQFQMALPRHLTPDRLLRVAMTAIQNTPKLLDCDRTSLYSAIMTCAQLGLEPDGVLGQAYLVPFAGRVQFIPGYKGLITLARNSGDVTSISAHEVRANDRFSYAFGLSEKLEHIPADGDRGEITHFYAVARFKDGGHHFDVMTKADVEAIRVRSPGKNSDPWKIHYAEMGKKTCIRRIAKYLPMNVQKAAALADSFESGRHATLNVHGDVVIDQEAQEPVGTDRQIAQGGSKLEQFEQTHGAETVNKETGEVTQPETAKPDAAKPAEAKPDAAAHRRADEPLSPLQAKKGQKAEWPAWVDWAVAEIGRMPQGDIAGFMEVKRAEMDFVSEQRAADWMRIEMAIDGRRADG